ncbi:uncharacterized protein si:ch211-227n13.3 [Solea solea]|uniref:uncharacterized protein si:ch211-227n13.3 n=1 Tax=Solea solea TaxID=90069 RepID=UPI00272C68B4|nr:uncharacterized protein si:ch211-227n13.3 [Solea solea]
MYPQRSTRLKRPVQKSPDEDVTQHKLRGKRPKTGRRRSKVGDGAVTIDDRGDQDISDAGGVTHVTKEDEGSIIVLADYGIESDEDSGSVNSSIVSGPSFLSHTTPKERGTSLHMCSACLKLYQKAEKMNVPMKDKLLDNDPMSLTCDQWVLMKKWRPRRMSKTRGTLLIHIQLVKKGMKQSEQSVCLRSHTFLQRNLRRCKRVPVKKGKKRKKRRTDNSQGSRVAKQPRLRGNKGRHGRISNSSADDGSLNKSCSHSSHEETNYQADTRVSVEMNPCTVALETTNARRKTPEKKTSGFRDLLAQLRGSSSIIVRETR